MRLRVISMIFLLCVTSTSCISNFRVKKGSTKLAGIPFYVKQARCKHESTYLDDRFPNNVPMIGQACILQSLPICLGQRRRTTCHFKARKNHCS